jgi:hypothetical protein
MANTAQAPPPRRRPPPMPALRRGPDRPSLPCLRRQPGLVPVALAQTADGPVTTFVAKRRHRLRLIFGVLYGRKAVISGPIVRTASPSIEGVAL